MKANGSRAGWPVRSCLMIKPHLPGEPVWFGNLGGVPTKPSGLSLPKIDT